MITIIDHASPNFNARPVGTAVACVVLHGTAGSSVEGDLAWLCDEARGSDGEPVDTSASYHYLVGRDGTVYQLVDEADRAWHAGESEWLGRPDVNDFSVGIGMTNRGPVGGDARNPGQQLYTTEQIMAAAELTTQVCQRHGVPWRNVVTHALVSPGRKSDPWLHFPWGEFMGAMLTFQNISAAG